MNIKNLQSLNQKFDTSKLLKICFLSTIIISTLLTASCTTAAPEAQKAQMEPCSYADSVQQPAAFQTALFECKQKANLGDTVSQKNLAYMYYFGNKNMPMDKFESVKWFKIAALQGNKQAQYRLDMIVGGTEFSQLSQ